jgi:hypothetical protein
LKQQRLREMLSILSISFCRKRLFLFVTPRVFAPF